MGKSKLRIADPDRSESVTSSKRIAPHRDDDRESPAGLQVPDEILAEMFECFERGEMPNGPTDGQYLYAASHYSICRSKAENGEPPRLDDEDEERKSSWAVRDDWIWFLKLAQFHPQWMKLSWDEAEKEIDWSCTPWDDNEKLGILLHWGEMRTSPWKSPIAIALRLAQQYPITPSRCEDGQFKEYAQTASLHGWLQVIQGDEPYFLTDEDAAEALGFSENTTRNHRKWLIREGFTRQVRKHVPNRRAARYRFAVEKFPELQGKGEL